MATYTKEPEPLETLKDLLEDNWAALEEVPKPTIVITNESSTEAKTRVDFGTKDHIIIRSDGAESIRYRGNITYYDRIFPIQLELLTKESRQRLRDMSREVKAICFDNKHDFSDYQLIRLNSYQESVNTELNIWRGIIRLQVEAHGITVESLTS